MIQQDIYKIPITKMNLESGAVCMIQPSQIIRNQVLPERSARFILSGGFSKSACLLNWSDSDLVQRGLPNATLTPSKIDLRKR